MQIKKGDIIVAVDGQAATENSVETLLRGEDKPVTGPNTFISDIE